MFGSSNSVGQWVRHHPQVAPIFEELQFDYCCGGDATLAEACGDSGFNLEDVLARLRSAIAEQEAPPAENWDDKPLRELCDHIESTHHAFLRGELPRLEGLVGKVVQAHCDAHPELVELEGALRGLRAELEPHMFKEERILFPAIRQLEGSDGVPRFPFGSVGNPIDVMEREHDAAGAALRAIRRITDEFRPPEEACSTWRVMLEGLSRLETDMHQHIHKENNILFPRAQQLEASRSTNA